MVIVGTCQTFCPAQEVRERTQQRQLHPLFEKHVLIKRYSRPAAGKQTDTPEAVRPPEVLLRTVAHLMSVTLTQADFSTCYPFVWDRLWAVRQDLTLQQTNCKSSRAVLAQCARFYVAAATLGAAQRPPLNVFDPAVNATHFMDTISRLLHLYEDHDVVDEDRPEMESLYLLWNVDSFAVLMRAVSLHPVIKRHIGETPFDVAKALLHGNMYRLLRAARHFRHPLEWSALAPKLFTIRARFVRALNAAYSSKQCVFPLSSLARWLDMTDEGCEELLAYCNISVTTIYENSAGGDNEQRTPVRNVAFLKSRTDLNLSSLENCAAAPPPPYFVSTSRVEQLRTQIGSLVLCGAVQ